MDQFFRSLPDGDVPDARGAGARAFDRIKTLLETGPDNRDAGGEAYGAAQKQ